jgi:putative ABC transport system permease protein
MLADARRRSRMRTALVGGRALIDLLSRLPPEWWTEIRGPSTAAPTESTQRRWGGRETMMTLLGELRIAARTLAKRPGFTAVIVTTLGLGIGANVAIFAIVDAVLLRPLPYEESERIVEMRHHAPGLGLPELGNSEGMLGFYAENLDVYEATAAFDEYRANLTGGEEAARVHAVAVSPDIFRVLRVRPSMGRPFGAGDAAPGAARVAILAHDTWRSRFGGDREIVGRTIQLDGDAVEVVGVMADGFSFADDEADLYTPMYVDPNGPFGTFGLRAVSRLAPGVTPEVAERRSMEALTRLGEAFPDLSEGFVEQAGFSVTVETLRDRTVVDVESTLWVILGTVGFVLLIACANVANLFMVRAESRQKEMAVRAAIGAGRRGVVRSLLSESVILALAGGAVGLAFAAASVPVLLSMTELPRSGEVAVGPTSFALAAVLSVVVGLAFGSLPLTRYGGRRFGAILRDGTRGTTGGRDRHRARNLLAATQLALALMLLVGSGLMLRSFVELRAVDLGIEPEGVLTVGLSRNAGEDPDIAARFYQDAADRIAALPGVRTVGITTHVPLGEGSSNGGSFYIESKPRDESELPPTAMYRAVGGDYFTSMGIPVVSGRTMERADWEESRPVIWVNETFAKTYLDGDAVGERIAWDVGGDEPDAQTRWAEVVGVVGDVREFGLADEAPLPRANAYLPLRPGGGATPEIQSAFLTIEMAEGRDPASVAPAVRAEIRTLDSQVPITATRTMDDVVSEAMRSTSITMILLAIATAVALFLGAIGLAGVISYVVGQRTREIGVRVALGATGSQVGRMILRQSLKVTLVGAAVGLAGALGLTRSMKALLFDVSATDPVTFVAAPLVLVGVSLLATWLPVRRATRVNPTVALRAE